MIDVETTGTPAGGLVESGGAVVDDGGGDEPEVGVSWVDAVDGPTVVGGTDVV